MEVYNPENYKDINGGKNNYAGAFSQADGDYSVGTGVREIAKWFWATEDNPTILVEPKVYTYYF